MRGASETGPRKVVRLWDYPKMELGGLDFTLSSYFGAGGFLGFGSSSSDPFLFASLSFSHALISLFLKYVAVPLVLHFIFYNPLDHMSNLKGG
jgi:hypothetical protein